jgi:hypothetical protein
MNKNQYLTVIKFGLGMIAGVCLAAVCWSAQDPVTYPLNAYGQCFFLIFGILAGIAGLHDWKVTKVEELKLRW